MKYCSSSYQSLSILDTLDEIRYTIRNINQALERAEKHPEQTIIIEIPNLYNIENYHLSLDMLVSICSENKNIRYDLFRLNDIQEFYEKSQEMTNATYYHIPITTWTMINLLEHMNIGGITLGDPLCYEFNKVKAYKKHSNMIIRLNPTMASNEFVQKYIDDSIDQPWILPQSIEYIEGIVDVLDLLDDNVEREKTIIKIYKNDKDYNLPLNLLFPHISSAMNGHYPNKGLIETRLNCGHSCVYNDCHICGVVDMLYNKEAEKVKIQERE